MIKVVLISVYNEETPSVRYIHSQLIKEGFDAYMIYFGRFDLIETEYPTNKDFSILVNLLKEIKPVIVGISTMTLGFNVVKELINLLKNINVKLIVLGGTHARIMPEECIKYADVVCIGEAEIHFPILCKKFIRSENITNIPNFWVKRGNKIFKNPIQYIDLDSISLPDFNSEKVYYIKYGILVKGKWFMYNEKLKEIVLAPSRGCFFRCAYCINSKINSKVRRKSVDRLIEELKIIKSKFPDVERFNFQDESFVSDINWIKEFCPKYKAEINVPLKCQLHPSEVNDELISLLKSANVVYIIMGIQSGSDRVRREIYNRFTSDVMIRNAIYTIQKYNISCYFDLIINNPLETDDDLREGISFLLSLPRTKNYKLFHLTNYPKTALTEKFLKEGIIKKADISFEDSKSIFLLRQQQFDNVRDEYWFYIFNFLSKLFIPRFLIIFFTKDIFVKHPTFLLRMFRFGNKLYQLRKKEIDTYKEDYLMNNNDKYEEAN